MALEPTSEYVHAHKLIPVYVSLDTYRDSMHTCSDEFTSVPAVRGTRVCIVWMCNR